MAINIFELFYMFEQKHNGLNVAVTNVLKTWRQNDK